MQTVAVLLLPVAGAFLESARAQLPIAFTVCAPADALVCRCPSAWKCQDRGRPRYAGEPHTRESAHVLPSDSGDTLGSSPSSRSRCWRSAALRLKMAAAPVQRD